MKFTKLPALLLCFLISLNSCSSFGEVGKALRNEKSKSTDEFLIKKKEPLTQPPDFENIPDQKGNYRETLRVNDDLINLLNWQPKDRLKEYIANL